MSVSNPIISIIIPTFNRAHLLERTVDSVLKQTCTDFEIIIIDDASQDDTKNVVQRFKNHNIKYLRQNENKGAPAARNRGINEANGKYIAFLDSDDEWVPEKLEKQLALFEKSAEKVGAIYTGLTYIDSNNKQVGTIIPNKEGDLDGHIVFTNCVGPLSSVMARRECFKHCGLFDEKFPSNQDWDLFIRIAEKYHFAFLKDVLVFQHISGERITTNPLAKANGHKIILEKYYEQIKNNNIGHSHHRFTIGHYLALSNQINESRKEFLKAVFLNPFQLKYYLHLLSSMLGANAYRRLANLKGSMTS